jgi:hypothetical protein
VVAGEFRAGEPWFGGTRLRRRVINPLVGPALLPVLCALLFFGLTAFTGPRVSPRRRMKGPACGTETVRRVRYGSDDSKGVRM